MRLKTSRIKVDVPVSDDGSFISVNELKKTEISKIIEPCRDFFFREKEGDSADMFLGFIKEMESKEDFSGLFILIDCFHNLFRKMACGWSGIEDEDESALEFSKDNIEKVIEFDEEGFILKFVVEALASITRKKEEISKNCKAGSRGSSTLTEPAVKNAEDLSLKIVENVTGQEGFASKMNDPLTPGVMRQGEVEISMES